MEPELKKLFSNAESQKRELISRYKKYMGYCQLFSSSDNEGIRKVYGFLEKDASAYMAPAVLLFVGYKLTPRTLKDKELNIMQSLSIITVAGDSINASILHAIRILLDRISLYIRIAYPDLKIGDKIGPIEEKKSVIKFIDERLSSNKGVSKIEREFFTFILKEYNEWLHKVLQVDNKTKHNLSAYDRFAIGIDNFPPIILSTSKGYYHNRELTEEKEIPVDFEACYVSRAYDLFDKSLEFTTSIIISQEKNKEQKYGKGET